MTQLNFVCRLQLNKVKSTFKHKRYEKERKHLTRSKKHHDHNKLLHFWNAPGEVRIHAEDGTKLCYSSNASQLFPAEL